MVEIRIVEGGFKIEADTPAEFEAAVEGIKAARKYIDKQSGAVIKVINKRGISFINGD